MIRESEELSAEEMLLVAQKQATGNRNSQISINL